MNNIELVIKIPEEMYKWIYDVNKFSNDYGMGDFIDLIKNGTVLPKGHGRLIDVSKLEKDIFLIDGYSYDQIMNANTVIEADKPKILYKDRWYNGLVN